MSANGTKLFALQNKPVELDILNDLLSRFNGSFCLNITPLTDEQIALIIKKYFLDDGIDFNDKFTNFLLANYSRNVEKIMPIITQIKHLAYSNKMKITLSNIKEIIKNHVC